MAFRNSILAGEELVRSGIRSENYVAGVAGWRLSRDGVFEALDALLRGQVIVGVGDPRIEIVPDFDGFGTPVIAFYPDGGGPPVLMQLAGSEFVLSSPTDDAQVRLGSNVLTVLAASGGVISFEVGGGIGDIVFNAVPAVDDGSNSIPLLPGTHGLETGFTTTGGALGGRHTFPHGLGVAPSAVLATPRGPASGATIFGQIIVESWDATDVTVRCFSNTGTALASVSVLEFSWVALP